MVVWAPSTTLCNFLWSWMEQFPDQLAVMQSDKMLSTMSRSWRGLLGRSKLHKPSNEVEMLVCLGHSSDVAVQIKLLADIEGEVVVFVPGHEFLNLLSLLHLIII